MLSPVEKQFLSLYRLFNIKFMFQMGVTIFLDPQSDSILRDSEVYRLEPN